MYEVTLIFKNSEEVKKGIVVLKNLLKTMCGGREDCIIGNGMDGELYRFKINLGTTVGVSS